VLFIPVSLLSSCLALALEADVDGVFSKDSSIRYWWMGQSVNWRHYKVSGLKGGSNGLHKGGILPTYVIALVLGIIGWLTT
jgi:hypothetical protein